MLGCSGRVLAAGREPTAPARLAQARNAPLERLSTWVNNNGGKVSLTVMDLQDSRILLSQDGEVPRNPASTTKLVTARVASGTLGLTHRFTTAIHGEIHDGHASRLVIRSDGNPTLTTNDLRGLVAELVSLGLVVVDEGVWVDQSAFDEQYVPPAFEQQPEEWAAFRAPVCATAIDRNRLTIRVTPGKAGKNAQVFVEPPGYAEVEGTVETRESGVKTTGVRVSVTSKAARVLVRISGSIGEKSSQFVVYRRANDPRLLAGFALRELLRERGIRVPEQVAQTTSDTSKLPLLVSLSSEALAVVLRNLGKESDNFTAEMLLKAIAAKRDGKGSSEAGAKIALEYLATLQPLERGSKLINGSGLFDANRISTNQLVRVLEDVYRDPTFFPEFASQLSIGHEDGTLQSRFTGLRPGCYVRAKTGTLRATNALAGYLERPKKSPIAFAILVDGVTNSAALKPEMDAFVAAFCEPIAW